MSTLAVNFFKLDSLIGDLGVLESKFNDRINTVSSAYSSVTSIYNEFGYLTYAANELAYKVDELEESRDKIATFKTTVSEFRTMAYDEESGMADRIFMDADTFMDEMGITPEYEKSAWDKFCEKVSDVTTMVVDAVTDAIATIDTFIIENWDLILTVVGEILVAAVAIATFILTFPVSGVLGALTMVAYGWIAFKAVTELMGDAAALGYTIAGDEERAKEAADYDAKELFDDIGEGLNDITGWDYWDEVMDGTYIALDTIELVVDIVNPVQGDDVIDAVSNVGKTIKDIPDKGFFALNNVLDTSEDTVFDKVFEYFDSTSEIITDALEENDIISEETHTVFDTTVDTIKFYKDLSDDSSNLSGALSGSGYSTLGDILVAEGTIHETYTFVEDLLDEQPKTSGAAGAAGVAGVAGGGAGGGGGGRW